MLVLVHFASSAKTHRSHYSKLLYENVLRSNLIAELNFFSEHFQWTIIHFLELRKVLCFKKLGSSMTPKLMQGGALRFFFFIPSF